MDTSLVSLPPTTLNEPRVIVYVTPRPLSCMTQHYMPPEADCARIRDLWAQNVNPQLNATVQPSPRDIRSCTGYVLLEGSQGQEIGAPERRPQFLIKCSRYPEAGAEDTRVLILHWYPQPLTEEELDAMLPLWSAFYGLTPENVYTLPDSFHYLVATGVLGTTTPIVSEEEFQAGNDLIIPDVATTRLTVL